MVPRVWGPGKVSGVAHSSNVERKVKTLLSGGKGPARTFSVLPRARLPQMCSSWGGELGGVLPSVGREQPYNWIEPERSQSPAGPFAVSSLRERTERLAWDLRGMWSGKIQVSFPTM